MCTLNFTLTFEVSIAFRVLKVLDESEHDLILVLDPVTENHLTEKKANSHVRRQKNKSALVCEPANV